MDGYKIDYGQLISNMIANDCMDLENCTDVMPVIKEFADLSKNSGEALKLVSDNFARITPGELALIAVMQAPYIHLCEELCKKYGFKRR